MSEKPNFFSDTIPTASTATHTATPTGDATGGVIPYKNPQALIGYYTGLAAFALSCLPGIGLILGIVALVLGIRGFRAYRKTPVIGGPVHAWIAIAGGSFALLLGLVFLGFILAGILGAAAQGR